MWSLLKILEPRQMAINLKYGTTDQGLLFLITIETMTKTSTSRRKEVTQINYMKITD